MGTVTIGVDIGQKRDSTAIVVIEEDMRWEDERAVRYAIARHIERLPLGTSYPDVATRLKAIVEAIRARGSRPTVYADATGVGLPVVDLMRKAGVPVTAVLFTYGDQRSERSGSQVTLGKAWMVSGLQALLQTGRILLPKTSEAEALAAELLDYEIKVSDNGTDTFGAFKTGTHDDLVTALGLACQDILSGRALPYSYRLADPVFRAQVLGHAAFDEDGPREPLAVEIERGVEALQRARHPQQEPWRKLGHPGWPPPNWHRESW